VKNPAEILRRLQLLQVRARLCSAIDTALKINLMISTVEYLLDLNSYGAQVVDQMIQIPADEFEILKEAEGIYEFYMRKFAEEDKKEKK
jgi:hypothetical protein